MYRATSTSQFIHNETMLDYAGFDYKGDDAMHHIIISIKEADIAKWDGIKAMKSLDPYVKVILNNVDPDDIDKKVETRKIYQSNGSPQWNFVVCTKFQLH